MTKALTNLFSRDLNETYHLRKCKQVRKVVIRLMITQHKSFILV